MLLQQGVEVFPTSADALLEVLNQSLLGTSTPNGIQILEHEDEWERFLAVGEGGECILGILMPEEIDHVNATSDVAHLQFRQKITSETGISHGPYMVLTFDSQFHDDASFVAALFQGLIDLSHSDLGLCADAAHGALATFSASRGTGPLSDEIQAGIFGELAVILNMQSKLIGVQSWSASPFATFDFSVDHHRLEVKSSLGPLRRPWLSMSQSQRSQAETVTLVSVYVPPATHGLTVLGLGDLVAEGLPAQAREKIMHRLAPFRDAQNLATFDLETVRQSFLYWPMESVAQPLLASPTILRVKWQVQLDQYGVPGEGPDFWQSL